MMRKNVVFSRPQHTAIQKEGLAAVDMHSHSCYSDTTTRLSTIAKKARKLGIGIALSDHNAVAGNIKLAQDNPDLFVIPAMEVTTKEMAHVLMYFDTHDELQEFYDNNIRDKKAANPYTATSVSIPDLVDISKDSNCVLAPAHPFAFPRRFSFISAMKRGHGTKEVLKSFHAVETICGANVRMMNKKAVAWSSDLNKAAIGGSDSHSIGTLGRVVTKSEATTVSDFLDTIRKKQTSVVGVEEPMYSRPVPYTKIACKHLKYFRPTIKNQFDISIRMPARAAKNKLRETLSAAKREERSSQIRAGMASLAEEIRFPKIKRGKIAMRFEQFKRRF